MFVTCLVHAGTPVSFTESANVVLPLLLATKIGGNNSKLLTMNSRL